MDHGMIMNLLTIYINCMRDVWTNDYEVFHVTSLLSV